MYPKSSEFRGFDISKLYFPELHRTPGFLETQICDLK
jgi:hypothetical protein